jgi:hypothetical protein
MAVILALFLTKAFATEAYKRIVVDPPQPQIVLDGACVPLRFNLVNADGELVKVPRDKDIIFKSSSSSTEFFENYEPICAQVVKSGAMTLPAGSSGLKFYIRHNLAKGVPPNTPQKVTITITARGARTGEKIVEVRTQDCGVGCRETCLETRLACTKKCGMPGKDVDVRSSTPEMRKCWRDCFDEEIPCLANCEPNDVKLIEKSCPEPCLRFCDEKYRACFGKCYFHEETRSTMLGAKCTDDCTTARFKCYDDGCAANFGEIK